MAQEDQIAQVLGTLPNLTQEQLDALAKFDTAPLDAAIEVANNNHGFAADREMNVVAGYVAEGAKQMAKVAILGILSGDATLTKPWTDIVGEFASPPVAAAVVLSTPAVSEDPQDTEEATDKPVVAPIPEFQANLVFEDQNRQVLLFLADGEGNVYQENGTTNYWTTDVLTDITPYVAPVDPAAGAI